MLNQKTVTILEPELLRLDFNTSETEEILISRTNHQLYFVLKIRISSVSHTLKYQESKIRDSVNQNLASCKLVSLRLSVMQNFEQTPCFNTIPELDVTILYFSINANTVLTSLQPYKHMLHTHLRVV